MDRWAARLADVPGLAADLELHRAGQVRFSSPEAGSGDGLPFGVRAGALRSELDQMLAELCQLFRITHPPLVARAVDRLLGSPDRLARHPDGPRLALKMQSWYTNTLAAIDAPADRVYLGLCQCGTPLRAVQGSTWHRCRRCQVVHSVPARLAEIDSRLRDVVGTVAELTELAARAYRGRLKVTRRTVESLIERGRLVRVGRRLPYRYRAGDLFGLLDARLDRENSRDNGRQG